ncbi:MAG TPA: PQQ-binding-like beta-propeller repeat protein [Gaiellaceae bacterium]
MPSHLVRRIVLTGAVVLTATACSGGTAASPGQSASSAGSASDWPLFGYTAARANSGPSATGITSADVGRLWRQRVLLDGTVDSSPIYLHAVRVRGAVHDVFFVTTTYGRTEAIDASSGRVLWRYTPAGYSSWVGTARITTATPAADPGRKWIYAASPDGRIQKLSVADGHLAWRTRITLLPSREKIASALNYWHGRVIATTGGYIGDAPPYQGHVALLAASNGRLSSVWNSLCSNRHQLISPSSCASSDSAIWGRAGAVVDTATGGLLVATGNGDWNGRTNWGDSTVHLSADASRVLGSWTPTNEAALQSSDLDLGSTSPVFLGSGYLAQGGKDGKIRLLRLSKLSPAGRTGGELQTISTPGTTDLFTAPAVWHADGQTWFFVADNAGLAAWTLGGGRLHPAWSTRTPGTSPVVAGGLLYVYDPNGGLGIYLPRSGKKLRTLAAAGGHWNSAIVADGRIALPEGDANQHALSGVLDIYRLG